MINLEFEWDAGNEKHVLYDHPDRNNTKEEVESIFRDPTEMVIFDREDPNTGEPRYWTMGIGTEGIVKFVVFVNRNGKIRPITCYVANSNQQAKYHEYVRTKRRAGG